jgi:hypothetical protein
MRRSVLVLLLTLAAFPAAATEQSELQDCFDALSPYSLGFGTSIGPWEWAPPVHYPTITVPSDRAGVEGIYIYSEDQVYFADFAKVPRELRSNPLHWFPFLLGPLRSGRGVFHCSYESLKGEEQRKVACDYGEFYGDTHPFGRHPELKPGDKYYYPIDFKALTPDSANRAVLRTAVLSRIMSVTRLYSKKVAAYGERLEAHKKRLTDGPGALTQLTLLAGFSSDTLDPHALPPTPPPHESERGALQACGTMQMNDQLAEAARTEIHLLDNYPLPQ